MFMRIQAAQPVDPEAYRKERGRCPRGYRFDGEKCVKTAPKGKPKGKGRGKPKEPLEKPPAAPKRAPRKAKAPKKQAAKPQGPAVEVTRQNPYGLAEQVRSLKTAADLGGHAGLRKVLGHMEPSKYPPPDVDPATIKLNLDGDNDSKAMMTWRDNKGRLQAAYTPKFLNRNAAVKWERVKTLESKAEKAIETFGSRMQDRSLSAKDRDAAAILTIIGKTGLRPGSRSGLKSTGNRGISTLSADNVKIQGGVVELDFIGKSGKRNRTRIEDPELAHYLTDRLKGKSGNDLLFEAAEKDLPRTMKAAGVGGFKPKDFRTRKAGQIAAQVMSDLEDPPPPLPANKTKAKRLVDRRIKEASSAVADQLNNTPAMAKKAYINPAIFTVWAEQIGASKYLSLAAQARKPTAEELWKKALDIKLPDADQPVEIEQELEDDDQLDSIPEPVFEGDVEANYRFVESVMARLLEAGHRDIVRQIVQLV